MPRRPLLLVLVLCSALLTLGLARAPSLPAFTALTFLVGVFTVTPQARPPALPSRLLTGRRC